MNIEEGGRRLVAVISWIVAIFIWLAWFVLYRKVPLVWYGVGVVVGIIAGLICSRIGLWIVDGFMVDQENNE